MGGWGWLRLLQGNMRRTTHPTCQAGKHHGIGGLPPAHQVAGKGWRIQTSVPQFNSQVTSPPTRAGCRLSLNTARSCHLRTPPAPLRTATIYDTTPYRHMSLKYVTYEIRHKTTSRPVQFVLRNHGACCFVLTRQHSCPCPVPTQESGIKCPRTVNAVSGSPPCNCPTRQSAHPPSGGGWWVCGVVRVARAGVVCPRAWGNGM